MVKHKIKLYRIKSILILFFITLLTSNLYAVDTLKVGTDTTICSGNSLTISTDIQGTYLWSDQSTGQSITVSPGTTTTYSLTINNGINTVILNSKVTVDNGCIWPGDADRNGVVDNVDVLRIALAYGYKGPPRIGGSNDFSPQHANDWNKSFKSGLNYKYADCNGDGVIDSKDLIAIHNNYSDTHHKTSEAMDDGNPDLYLVPNKDSISPGDTVIYHIYLGTDTTPVNNIYGLAFIHQFTFNSIQSGSMNLTVTPDNCWLYNNEGPAAVMSFIQPDYNVGSANITISRTNGASIASGHGQIGDLSAIGIDNVGGKRSSTGPLLKGINVTAISSDETVIPLSIKVTAPVYYKNASSGIANSKKLMANISIFPNPVTGNVLNIDVKNVKAEKVEILDLLGKTVYTSAASFTGETQITLPNLKSGFYMTRIITNQGIVTNKINIIN